jgi:hypothetical protein
LSGIPEEGTFRIPIFLYHHAMPLGPGYSKRWPNPIFEVIFIDSHRLPGSSARIFRFVQEIFWIMIYFSANTSKKYLKFRENGADRSINAK